VRAAAVALAVLIGPMAAVAQTADCTPMDEVDFRGLVLQSQAAIDRGDAELSTEILREIEQRLPCLTYAPPPRLWSDYLVSRAIDAFAAKGDWQSSMDAALWLRPTVERGVASAHPLARYEAKPKPEGAGKAVPHSAEVYVNGLRAETLPPDHGLWLVQRRDGKWWSTQLVLDGEVSDSWLTTPVEGPPRIVIRMHVGGGLGARYTNMARRWEGDTFDPDDIWQSDYLQDHNTRPVPMVHARGQTTFFSPFGVAGEVAHPATFGAGLQLDARAAAIFSPGGRSYLGGGLGLVALDLWEGVPQVWDPESGEDLEIDPTAPAEIRERYTWRTEELAYPHFTGLLRGPASNPWDFSVVVGLRANFFHLELDQGVPLHDDDGEIRWRLGFDVAYTGSNFQQTQNSDRKVLVGEWRGGLEFSRILGEP